MTPSRAQTPALFTNAGAPRPAVIPHELPGDPPRHPQTPARDRPKSLLSSGIPAYPAQAWRAKPGLSRRRSRVRVPSLPYKSWTSEYVLT